MTEKLKFAAAGRLRVYGNHSELRRVVESIGAEFEKDITSETSYVISNEPRNSDNAKIVYARRQKIPIITEEEFCGRFVLKRGSGEASPPAGAAVASSPKAGVRRKYKCRMCGLSTYSPGEPCPACGGTDFDTLAFDATCRHCGSEYYADEADTTCPVCGRALFEPKPPPRPLPKPPPAPRPTPPPAPRPSPPPAPRPAPPPAPAGGPGKKTSNETSCLQVLLGLVICGLAIWGVWWLLSRYWLPVLVIAAIVGYFCKD